MHRFIDGEDRMQQALLPHSPEDYVSEENPVRVIEVFIGELDLAALGFSGMTPAATGRPAYHPSKNGVIEAVGSSGGCDPNTKSGDAEAGPIHSRTSTGT